MGHTFEPLKKEPAYVKVYNAVEAEVLSGLLLEGATLPTEAELCQQFGVTRATVREGLRLLEQADLVQRGAAKRFYVKRPNAEDVATSTSKGLALGGATFREAWEALQTLYPPAARLAVKRLTKADIAVMQQQHDAFLSLAPEASDDLVRGAVAFFQAVAEALNNRVLLALLQSLNLLIDASLRQVIEHTPKAHSRIAKAQAQIIGALRDKDEDQAAKWMAKHIDDLKRGYAVAKVDMDKGIL